MRREPTDRAGRAHAATLFLRDESQEGVLEAGVAGTRSNPQLIQPAVGDEPALGHDADAIGHALGDLQNMGRHDHRAAGADALAQHVLHHARRTGVEAGEGFVQDDQPWLMHERAGQRQLLTHSLGKLRATFIGMGSEAEPGEQLARPRLGELRVDPPQPGHEVEILHRRQLVVEHRLVRNPGHDALGADGIGQRVDAKDGDRSAVGRKEAGDHAHGGRLARAIGSEQTIEFAGGDAQIEPVHRRALEGFGEPTNS